MANNPVEKDDLVRNGAIPAIKQELDDTLTSLNKVDAALISIAKTLSGSFKKALSDTLKGINDLNKAEVQSQKLLQEKIRTEQTIIKLSQQEEKLVQAEIKTKSALSRETERLNKIKEREAKATIKSRKAVLDSINPYKRLTKQVNTAQMRFKRLAVQYGETDKKTIRARNNFMRLDNQLRKVNNDARDGRRDVGRYGLATEKMGNSVRKVTGLLGQFGLAIGGAAAVRKAISVISQFDEKVADVAKTTGLTIEASKELSLELLKIDTRTPIGQLQELASAAGRLGIQGTANILAFTETADKVFVALGDDLGGSAEEIATNLGKVSNNFGLLEEFGVAGGIERIGSSMNELSASGASSAGAILDFTNRMAGLSDVLEVSDVQALGALFDESGQSVEVASSTLSKLLPTLATEFEKFAKIAGKTPEEFKKVAEEAPIEALKLVAEGAKNNEKGLFSLTKTLESYGVTSARAAGIVGTLTNKTDRLTELQEISTKAIEENTSVTDEFSKKNDTLAANYDKLKNRLTAYILGTEGATGASGKLKDALKFLTQNLTTILSVLGKLIKVFIAYKVLNSELVKGTKAFGIELKKNNFNLKKTSKALKDTSGNMDEGAKSAKGLGAALTSIGFALMATLVLELAEAFFKAASGANAFADAQARIAKQNKLSEEKASKRSEDRSKSLAEDIKAAERLAELATKAAKSDRERAQIESNLIDQKAELVKVNNELIRSDIRSANSKRDKLITDKNEVELILRKISNDIKLNKEQAETAIRLKLVSTTAADATVNLLSTANGVSNATQVLNEMNAEIQGANTRLTIYNAELDQSTESIGNLAHQTELHNTELDKGNKKTEKQISLLRLIRDEQLEQISNIEEREVLQARESAARIIEDKNLTNAVESEKVEFAKEINESLIIDIAAIRKKFRDEELEAEKQHQADIKAIILEAEESEQAQIDLAFERSRIDKRIELLNDHTKDKEQVEREYTQFLLDQIETRLLNVEKGSDEEKAILLEQANLRRSLLDSDVADAEKEFLKTFIQIEQAITKALEDEIDKRIAMKDKEIQKAQSAQDFFKQLAANGNIEAKQSFKEQIEFEKEAEREKAKLEKQKANIQLFSTALQTFQNELAGGAKPLDALGTTFLTTTVLTGFLSGLLNFFAKGTGNAPEGMAVVDEKGAEIITDKKGNIKSLGTGSGPRLTHLESGDIVKTAAQTSNIMAGLDNVNNAQQMSNKVDSAGNSFDLVSMQRGITKAFDDSIKKLPHSKTNWVGISQGMGKVVEDKVRGNDIERTNHYTS